MGKIAGQAKAKSKPAEESGKLQAIHSDVASFAASLGLAAGAGVSSGFDDSDFRKTGSIRRPEKEKLAGVEKEKKGKENKKDGKGVRPGKKPRWDTDRKSRGRKSFDEIKGRDANGASGDKSPGGWKSKQYDVNSKKRKVSWEVGADGESEAKRHLVERPYGEPELLQKLRSEAEELLERAANDFEKNRSRDKDAEWLLKARRSGTSADKVAAMTVILQENPKANVRTLDSLLGMMTSKAGKRHAATGIDALKELFLYNLLPDRKLKYFAQQPLSTLPEGKERASLLLDWSWEDCLKHRYERFVIALDEASRDKLPFLKEKALKSVYELLKAKPEQERRLLSSLVNKLGDPERKVASNASYLLSNLLTAHPNMKKVVVDEVDAFVFRPHVGLRAMYYAAVFLNQIVLSVKGDGPKLAKQLIDLYFALFKAVTIGDHEVDKDKDGKNGTKAEKGRWKGKWKENEKAKSLAAHFTTEIDSRLLSALLTGVNRAFPYISAGDLDTVTQENSVLFRLVHSSNFNVAVQALMLLHQLMVKNQAVNDRFYRALYSVLLSESLAKSSKAEMFLGVIFKALKSDVDIRRMSAFAKRLTQVAMQQSPEFACASLLLISETLKVKPTLWNAVVNAEDHDDDVEHFEDQEADSDEKEDKVVEESENGKLLDPEESGDTWPQNGYYNPKARDPLYCQAHRACWWELTVLAKHVHPSVAAMARTLLAGTNIVYSGDPLRDLALGVFLDRFVEKKPKAIKGKAEGTWHGSSMALPTKLIGAKTRGPVGEDILKLAEEDVAPEDVVFHKFYATKSTRSKPKKKSKAKSEDDVLELGEVAAYDGDDSDDDEIDELLEQEAGLEMMTGEDDSEVEDVESDDEEMVYHDKDEDDEDDVGSDGEEADSDGEEADALLEAGLEMSSSDGEIESAEEDVGSDEEDFLPKKGKKQKAARKPSKKPASVLQEAEDSDVEVEEEDVLLKKLRSQKPVRQPAKKRSSPLVELEDSDCDDADEGHLSLKKGKNKTAGKRRLSVFQEAGSDSDDAGLMKLSKSRGRYQHSRKKVGRKSPFQEADASPGEKFHKSQ